MDGSTLFYNDSYIICGIIISVIMMLSFRRYKQTPLRPTRFFISIVIINTFAGLSQLVQIISINTLRIPTLTYIAISGYFIFHFMCALLMLLYIYSFNAKFMALNLALKILVSAPFAIGELLILTNPFTNLVFTVDENNVYTRGKLIWVIYGLAAVYMLLTVYNVLKNRLDYLAKLRNFMLMWTLATAVAMLIQFIAPSELVETFAVTASSLVLFLNVQSPHELFDNETGMFNKVTFTRYTEYNFRTKKRFTVIDIVLDDFAAIGRAFGVKHSAAALKDIVEFLQKIDKNAKLYLTKSNVFTAVIPNDSEEFADAYVDKIHSKFSKTWHFDDNEMMISVRTCTIYAPKDVSSYQELHEVMSGFEKENTGKPLNKASDINCRVLRVDTKLKQLFENAAENNTLKIKYMPTYSFADKRFTSAKAVVHIEDKELGNIYSNECISVYQQLRNYERVGEFVLNSACRFINDGKLPRKGIDCITVRLPIVQCMHPEFISHFISIRNEYMISTSLIRFEIAENIVDAAGDEFSENMMRLCQSGAKLCLSEYGTGFTNISYIYDLPIECIRIDKKMVREAIGNEKVRIALDSTLSLIKDLGIKTMVEGIDTKELYDLISTLPCDYAEGRYFSEPLSELEFIDLITETPKKVF